MVQSSGIHLPGNDEVSFTDTNWATAPEGLPPAAFSQIFAFIAVVEGATARGIWDLW